MNTTTPFTDVARTLDKREANLNVLCLLEALQIGAHTVSELAEEIGVKSSGVSTTTKNLKARGLVQKAWADGGSVQVSLTPKGRKFLAGCNRELERQAKA